MIVRRLILLALTLMLSLSVVPIAAVSDKDHVTIAVSVPTLIPLVKAAGGDYVDVISVVPYGIDPHEYQLVPSDLEKISSADLLIVTGHFEWERKLKELTKVNNVLNLMEVLKDDIKFLRLPSGDLNLHEWWLSADNAILIIKSISSALIQIDEDDAERFKLISESSIRRIEDTLAHIRRYKYVDNVICSTPFEQYILDSFNINCKLMLIEDDLSSIKPGVLDVAKSMIGNGSISYIVYSDVSEGTIAMKAITKLLEETKVQTIRLTFISLDSSFDQILTFNSGILFSILSGKQMGFSISDYSPMVALTIGILSAIIILEFFIILRLRKHEISRS